MQGRGGSEELSVGREGWHITAASGKQQNNLCSLSCERAVNPAAPPDECSSSFTGTGSASEAFQAVLLSAFCVPVF